MTDRQTIPDSHKDLLQAAIGLLATNGRNGLPQLTAISYIYDEDDDRIKISLNDTRQKTINLQRDPHTTLFIFDPKNPYRTLEVRARAELNPDKDFTFAASVGAKFGADVRAYDQPGETRSIVVLHPIRIVATEVGA